MIGLVGGIGAGKTVAAAALAELGLQILDADAIGHALLTQRPARDRVLERFGSRVLTIVSDEHVPLSEQEIDRKALARIVFTDPAARRDLEEILHPSMRKTFERAIDRAGRNGKVGVALDAAILFEAGWNSLCDAVLFVDASREVRLSRLAASRGWTEEELDSREKAQASLDLKRERADHVLANDSDPEALRSAVAAWWESFSPSKRSRARPEGRNNRS